MDPPFHSGPSGERSHPNPSDVIPYRSGGDQEQCFAAFVLVKSIFMFFSSKIVAVTFAAPSRRIRPIKIRERTSRACNPNSGGFTFDSFQNLMQRIIQIPSLLKQAWCTRHY